MTTTTTMYKHQKIPGLTADAATWQAAGFTTYSNSDLVNAGPHGFDAFLVLGIDATGSRDAKAICWAMREKQRREEEKTRSTAIAREAEAISALAQAINSASEDRILEGIMSRLSERTRYAVLQQLRG